MDTLNCFALIKVLTLGYSDEKNIFKSSVISPCKLKLGERCKCSSFFVLIYFSHDIFFLERYENHIVGCQQHFFYSRAACTHQVLGNVIRETSPLHIIFLSLKWSVPR